MGPVLSARHGEPDPQLPRSKGLQDHIKRSTITVRGCWDRHQGHMSAGDGSLEDYVIVWGKGNIDHDQSGRDTHAQELSAQTLILDSFHYIGAIFADSP